jgi:hypothetical protein
MFARIDDGNKQSKSGKLIAPEYQTIIRSDDSFDVAC